MYLRKLTLSDTEKIYQEHMTADFPPAELKPLSRICSLWEQDQYRGFGLERDGVLLGYAFFFQTGGQGLPLLDYLAICRGGRGQGLGSSFLKLLRQEYRQVPGFLLEAEDPAFARDSEDRRTRERRLSFYFRAGLRRARVDARVYGVDYAILVLETGEPLSEQTLLQALETDYRGLFPERAFREHVRIFPEGRR